MSIDYSVDLGYGFRVKELTEEVESILSKNKDLHIMVHGDSYKGYLDFILTIKTSICSTWVNDELKPIKFALYTEDWLRKLQDIASQLKVDKPEIGWYLCANVS